MILPGELWIANITFTNHAASKRRPVLVLWLDGPDVVVAAVTTSAPRSIADVVLTGGAQAAYERYRPCACLVWIASSNRCYCTDLEVLMPRMLSRLRPSGAST